jgi:hypothetical protein
VLGLDAPASARYTSAAMKASHLGSRALILAIALAGCGDDGGGSGETADASTGMATDPGTGSTGSTMSTTMSTTLTTGDTEDTSSGSGSGGSTGSSGSDTDPTGEGSGSGSTGSGEGSGTGMTVDDCDACNNDEVCVENQAFESTFECHAIPDDCVGEVNCDCAAELCQDPFVACDDQSPGNTLVCICIAC